MLLCVYGIFANIYRDRGMHVGIYIATNMTFETASCTNFWMGDFQKYGSPDFPYLNVQN